MGKGLDIVSFYAILPVKPFKQAKSRLSEVLQPEEREALAINLFQRTVNLLAGIRRFDGVMVISRDTNALKLARECGVHTLMETGQPELNSALRRATEAVAVMGASGVFIMPADLPFASAEDVETMLYMGRYHQSVVIAPDGRRDGTNSMFMRPPNLMSLAYGEGSFERHKLLAQKANATIQIYESPRLALDIDTPRDLEQYRKHMKQTSHISSGFPDTIARMDYPSNG